MPSGINKLRVEIPRDSNSIVEPPKDMHHAGEPSARRSPSSSPVANDAAPNRPFERVIGPQTPLSPESSIGPMYSTLMHSPGNLGHVAELVARPQTLLQAPM